MLRCWRRLTVIVSVQQVATSMSFIPPPSWRLAAPRGRTHAVKLDVGLPSCAAHFPLRPLMAVVLYGQLSVGGRSFPPEPPG